MPRTCLLLAAMMLAATAVCAQQPGNLLLNSAAEEGDTAPLNWRNEGGMGSWTEDEVHSGARSLKLQQLEGDGRRGWTSEMIPIPEPGETQFMFSVWAKLEQVTGGSGAFIGFYHTDENGARIGQSGMYVVGGAGDEVATHDWARHITVSQLTPEVKGVRVNVRLYHATGTAWFDDMRVAVFDRKPITRPRSIRRGLRLGEPGACAIVSAAGADEHARELQAALRGLGLASPILAHDEIDLLGDGRDLIILGNLANSEAVEALYLRMYSLADNWFPGAGGYALRPLYDCLGTGGNYLVVEASDEAGLATGLETLVESLEKAGPPHDLPLTVETGPGWGGVSTLPWRGGGGRRQMVPAVSYLKSGDMEHAQAFREAILAAASESDEDLFGADRGIHLTWNTQSQSWDLMEACGVFSDDERVQVVNHMLRIMRSSEGEDMVRPSRSPRENHATRSARGFYYAWRHLNKYYRGEIEVDLIWWRNRLAGFWAGPFACSRSFEDSLSQHGLGGSMDNTLDIAFQEPEWSEEFFASGRARQMGERCIAICNNMGQTVMLGDTSSGDHPTSIFSKLAWKLDDPRYLFMINQRQPLGTTTDEYLRGFDVGIAPAAPEDHFGLTVIPADDRFFHVSLHNTEGVDFARAFDKLTFREGFDPADEYLMMDGTAGGSHSYDDANTFGEFSANGRRWLCEIDIFNGPTMSFHNAVTIARGGLGESIPPQSAEVMRSSEGEGWAYTATRLPLYNGCDWTRHTLWQPNAWTFVLDEMVAREPGDYSFVDGWRSLGGPTLTTGLLECQQDEVRRHGYVWSAASLEDAVTDSSGKYYYNMRAFDALLCRTDEQGDWLEMTVSIENAGEYAMTVSTLDYTGRGIVRVSVDGEPFGEPIDLYRAGMPEVTARRLGTLELAAGEHKVRFTAVGRNERSDNYYMAIRELNLAPPSTAGDPIVRPNRFRLVFPENVPVSLDRDHETLGQYLPLNRHRDQYLNILEQSMNATLEPGQAACFQNLFYATKDPQRSVELRRLTDHATLIRSDGELAMVGAALEGTEAQAGAVQASGMMFLVSPTRVLLCQAAASVGGTDLAEGTCAHPEAVRAALQGAWDATSATGAEGRLPWAAAPPLSEAWTADLAASPLSVEMVHGGEGVRLAVGDLDGMVTTWDAAGQTASEMLTDGPVHALEAADLDGDNDEELLVGSDDEQVYALNADLSERWHDRIEFGKPIWPYWTLGSSKVRRIYADDITGDGIPEVLMGVGNMHLHCYDAAGEELWRYRTDHGICTTITTADFFGDGRNLVLAGNGLTSSAETLWILDAAGEVVKRYRNGSWCTALPAIAVGDLDGDGNLTAFGGNNRGDVRAWETDSEHTVPLWSNNLTRPIRSLTVLPGVVAVGSDSGYLCAFDQAGEKAWGMPLSSAITHTALVRDEGATPVLAAGCKDGQVFIVTPDGRLIGHHDLGARLRDMVVADVDGDGHDDIVAVTCEPNRLVVISLPG